MDDQQQVARPLDGHGVSDHEQKTQQSPGFGRRTNPQAGQSQKNWHASSGMSARVFVPQSGQVMTAAIVESERL
jgi:hypothetical protein